MSTTIISNQTNAAISDKFDELDSKVINLNENTKKKIKDTNAKVNKFISDIKTKEHKFKHDKDLFIQEYNAFKQTTHEILSTGKNILDYYDKDISRLNSITNIKKYINILDSEIAAIVKDRHNKEFVSSAYFNVEEVAPILYLYYKDRGYVVSIIGDFDKIMISWANPPLQVIWYKIKTFTKKVISKVTKKKSE